MSESSAHEHWRDLERHLGRLVLSRAQLEYTMTSALVQLTRSPLTAPAVTGQPAEVLAIMLDSLLRHGLSAAPGDDDSGRTERLGLTPEMWALAHAAVLEEVQSALQDVAEYVHAVWIQEEPGRFRYQALQPGRHGEPAALEDLEALAVRVDGLAAEVSGIGRNEGLRH